MERLNEEIQRLIEGIDGQVGIYIKDLGSGETLAIGESIEFHAASMIKIPILWEALKQVEEKKRKLTDRILLRDEDKVGGCGVLSILQDGLELSLEDLLHLMIDISDNTATNMLIDLLGKENVNHRLKEMGIDHTFLARKLMIVIPGLYSYTCAKDMGILLEKLAISHGIDQQLAQKGIQILLAQQLNDKISRDLFTCGKCDYLVGHENVCPRCGAKMAEVDSVPVKFAHKTGEIVGVVHDGGILYRGGKTVIVVCLMKGLKNNREGNDFLAKIGLMLDGYCNNI